MSGRARLPGGEQRKASQRGIRLRPTPTRIVRVWRAGEAVRWKDRTGTYRHDVGDGEHSEITLGDRVYRVRTAELR